MFYSVCEVNVHPHKVVRQQLQLVLAPWIYKFVYSKSFLKFQVEDFFDLTLFDIAHLKVVFLKIITQKVLCLSMFLITNSNGRYHIKCNATIFQLISLTYNK